MRILIANDDGYLAPGLAALVQAMQGLGEIDVIAPEQNASGTSNALTLNRPLTVHRAGNGFQYLNGTPSDSVHVALTGLLAQRPDLVLSGINNGANMGDDTIYSGTVAASGAMTTQGCFDAVKMWMSGGRWSGSSSVPTRTNLINGPALA